MIVQYVDNCGISAPKMEIIDKFVSDLKALGFELINQIGSPPSHKDSRGL